MPIFKVKNISNPVAPLGLIVVTPGQDGINFVAMMFKQIRATPLNPRGTRGLTIQLSLYMEVFKKKSMGETRVIGFVGPCLL
jgi:hypothetical protein